MHHAIDQPVRLRFQRNRCFIKPACHILYPVHRPQPGNCLDTTDTGSNAPFGYDLEKADIPGTGDMGTAAQFTRKTDIEHTNDIPVFFAEQCRRTMSNRFVI